MVTIGKRPIVSEPDGVIVGQIVGQIGRAWGNRSRGHQDGMGGRPG